MKLKINLILIPILFLITLSFSAYSIMHNSQLERWMSEEYYDIGLTFMKTGTLSLLDGNLWTAVARPPGYSFFLGTVLKIWSKITTKENVEEITGPIEKFRYKTARESYRFIYFVQAVLLSISAIFIFIWLSENMRISTSFIIALLFGCNPYIIIYTGLIHYGILHIFFIVVSSYALMHVLSKNQGGGWKMIIPGILWGLTTLVRPTTLILPAFMLIFFWVIFSDAKIKAIKLALIFSAGMLISIAPYTIRNYHLTGKFIPVNLQSGIALWCGTVIKLERNPNYYKFWDLWYEHGCPIYKRVIKRKTVLSDTKCIGYQSSQAAVELDREFMDEAIHNIMTKPSIYAYNVVNTFFSFCVDINSVFIKIFQAIQGHNFAHYFHKDWIKVGSAQDFYRSTYQRLFEFYSYALTFFSFSGILLFIRRVLSCKKNKKEEKQTEFPVDLQTCSSRCAEKSNMGFWAENLYFLGSILICLTLFIAHSITYLDLMYYYQKIPFLFLFTAYFFNEMDKISIPHVHPNHLLWISRPILGALLLSGMVLTFLIIVVPT